MTRKNKYLNLIKQMKFTTDKQISPPLITCTYYCASLYRLCIFLLKNKVRSGSLFWIVID